MKYYYRCDKCENCIIDKEGMKKCYYNDKHLNPSTKGTCRFYFKGKSMTVLEYYSLRDSSVKYIEKRMDILNKDRD